MRDLLVRDEGSIYLLVPVTPAGQEWVDENLPADAPTWGTAIAIEHRYIADIVNGAIADGLTVGNH
jgi:hypothetical protein